MLWLRLQPLLVLALVLLSLDSLAGRPSHITFKGGYPYDYCFRHCVRMRYQAATALFTINVVWYGVSSASGCVASAVGAPYTFIAANHNVTRLL